MSASVITNEREQVMGGGKGSDTRPSRNVVAVNKMIQRAGGRNARAVYDAINSGALRVDGVGSAQLRAAARRQARNSTRNRRSR